MSLGGLVLQRLLGHEWSPRTERQGGFSMKKCPFSRRISGCSHPLPILWSRPGTTESPDRSANPFPSADLSHQTRPKRRRHCHRFLASNRRADPRCCLLDQSTQTRAWVVSCLGLLCCLGRVVGYLFVQRLVGRQLEKWEEQLYGPTQVRQSPASIVLRPSPQMLRYVHTATGTRYRMGIGQQRRHRQFSKLPMCPFATRAVADVGPRW